jgi:glutamate-1-semialdehyde 2,1-aminomutase
LASRTAQACRRRSHQHTIVAPFNDEAAVKNIFAANKNQIAGIIVEPVPGNAGLYLPKPGYLEFLSTITKADGALLIFDEVMTGFRLARGGAQERFGITPGLDVHIRQSHRRRLPVGAFGGRAEIMDYARAARPGVSGGDVERQSAGDGGGNRGLEEFGKAESGKRKAEIQ